MLDKLKKAFSISNEQAIITEKTNEIMASLKSCLGEDVKHVTKVKIIQNIKGIVYKAILNDESELESKLYEVKLAKELFEEKMKTDIINSEKENQ